VSKKKRKGTWYKYKTTPYHHQVKALKKLLSTRWGGALLMEPRTGKTKVLIDYASILHIRGHVNRVLVFCPTGVMGVWESEIPKHCPVKHRITLWDKDARKELDLPRFGQDVLDFVIVNYEAAATAGALRRDPKTGKVCYWRQYKKGARYKPQPDQYLRDEFTRELVLNDKGKPIKDFKARKIRDRKGGRYEFRNKIKAWQPQLIALDESHRIKNPSAAKSRSIHQFRDIASYRVIMTGTVVTKAKRIYDVYSQWLFLNWMRFVDDIGETMTYREFKQEFSVITERNGYPQWLRNKNEGKLHKLMHKDAYSVLRKDCFDLPPLTPQIIPIHLDESAEMYDAMAEDMVARITDGEVVEASIALVQGLRLRQLSNGIAKSSPTKQHPKGRLHIIGSEKLRVIEDRLEDLMEAREHVIIGASFRPDLQRLEKLCKKHRWKNFVVMGGVPRADRDRFVKEFENHDGGAVFIANPAAASEGIDLRSAAITIWYSLPTSWVNYSQFMDRNALHDGPRFVEYLLASGVDQLAYETLMADEDLGKRMITSPKRLLRDD
jgi:SNF2 family DNA or RNA helicase